MVEHASSRSRRDPVSIIVNPVAHRIKEATRYLHCELDSRVIVQSSRNPEESYQAYCACVLGYTISIEEWLLASNYPQDLDIDRRTQKSDWLRADLKELGLSSVEIMNLTTMAFQSPGDSIAHNLGVAYVIEGSMLGGLYLKKTLPPLDNCSRRFLLGYGKETGRLWREFKVLLDTELNSEAEVAASIEAAQSTFAQITAWFDHCQLLKP